MKDRRTDESNLSNQTKIGSAHSTSLLVLHQKAYSEGRGLSLSRRAIQHEGNNNNSIARKESGRSQQDNTVHRLFICTQSILSSVAAFVWRQPPNTHTRLRHAQTTNNKLSSRRHRHQSGTNKRTSSCTSSISSSSNSSSSSSSGSGRRNKR